MAKSTVTKHTPNLRHRPKSKPWMWISVGGYDIPIHLVSKPVADDGDRVDGICVEDRSGPTRWWIVVDRHLTHDCMWETIIHEALHAVSTLHGLGLSENRVNYAAQGLHQVLAPFLSALPALYSRGAASIPPDPASKRRKRRKKSL